MSPLDPFFTAAVKTDPWAERLREREKKRTRERKRAIARKIANEKAKCLDQHAR